MRGIKLLTTYILGLAPGACYSGVSVSGQDLGAGPGEPTDANTGGEGSGPSDEPVPAGYEATPVALRRLLADQYVESIRMLLGDQAANVASAPSDAALNGFAAVGAAQLALGSAEVDIYERSARAVADVAIADPAILAPYLTCTPTGPSDAACMETFVASFGRLAFRRTLAADEVRRYADVGLTLADDDGEFAAGMGAVVAAMLQSPLFLYQVETGEPDPQDPTVRRLKGTELATRLSFFLTGSTPNVELLDAAEAGELDGPAGLRSTAEALVEQPTGPASLNRFFGEVLRIHNLQNAPKDSTAFPAYRPELAAAMQEETRQLIQYIAYELDGDFSEVFDANYTFVNDLLAELYEIPGEFTEEFVRVELPEGQGRAGVLGHAGVLAAHSHVSSTSPTLRGKFVRETLLCSSIPPPPPGVVTDIPVNDEPQTLHERLEAHVTDPSCAACHELMDPIGFSLEMYDGIGAFRELDAGRPIDANGALDGTPITGADGLGRVLRDNADTHSCMIRNLYRHATGHIENPSEAEVLRDVAAAYADSGYHIKQALVEIAASPAFRVVGDPL